VSTVHRIDMLSLAQLHMCVCMCVCSCMYVCVILQAILSHCPLSTHSKPVLGPPTQTKYAFNQHSTYHCGGGCHNRLRITPPSLSRSDYVCFQPVTTSNQCGRGLWRGVLGAIISSDFPPPLSTALIKLRTHSTSSYKSPLWRGTVEGGATIGSVSPPHSLQF
jgi:hypothetical protein